MKVVIINGAAMNGKTNFSRFFKKHYEYKCVNWSTIDKIKKIAKRNFGWDGKKTNEGRKFLSEIKRIWGDYNNGPFTDMVKKIANHSSSLNKKDRENFIYFVDVREPYEIQKFVNEYGDNCITVLLKRDDREVPDNDADRNVANFDYDYTIENNGVKKDLEKSAIKFIEEIKNKKASN
jgi:dephospho-CoA kinase